MKKAEICYRLKIQLGSCIAPGTWNQSKHWNRESSQWICSPTIRQATYEIKAYLNLEFTLKVKIFNLHAVGINVLFMKMCTIYYKHFQDWMKKAYIQHTGTRADSFLLEHIHIGLTRNRFSHGGHREAIDLFQCQLWKNWVSCKETTSSQYVSLSSYVALSLHPTKYISERSGNTG